MLDADGATRIADVERLEKSLSKLAEDHVRFTYNVYTHVDTHNDFCTMEPLNCPV